MAAHIKLYAEMTGSHMRILVLSLSVFDISNKLKGGGVGGYSFGHATFWQK